jgi:hypothetical protein
MSSIARRLAALGGISDPDVRAWRDAVVTNGGSVSLARLIVVGQFVFSEKASGAWALTDDYWGFWAESEIQALTSLKQRRLATAANSPAFTIDRSYAFDAVTSYINLGFIPATHGVAMTATSTRLTVYCRTNVTSAGFAAGTRSTTNRRLTIRPRSGAEAYVEGNAQGAAYTLPASDSRGLTSGGRNGATIANGFMFKNGVALVKVADLGTLGASLPVDSIYIGGYNNVGALGGPLAASIGFAAVGTALSGAQELAQYNAVQAWGTSVAGAV